MLNLSVLFPFFLLGIVGCVIPNHSTLPGIYLQLTSMHNTFVDGTLPRASFYPEVIHMEMVSEWHCAKF